MSRFLIALALLALTSTTTFAQDDRPSIVVYPFGLASAARTTASDVAGLFAARALEGVQETDRFAAINESANPVIKSQLDGAMTLSQFESAVQIKTDRQLQSKYLLTGFIQSVETKAAKGRNNETIYETSLSVTVQLYNVETREAIASREIPLRNGVLSSVPPTKRCSGIMKKACEIAQEAASRAAEKKLSSSTGGSAGEAIKDETPQRALETALRNAPAKIAEFLNESIK